MTMTEIWDVIYLWEGERHRGGQHHSRSTAQAEVMAMRDAGWVCWMEYVGYREVN